MFAIVTTIKGKPNRVQGLEGFKGGHVLYDRKNNKYIITTQWETEQALKAASSPLEQMRRKTMEILGANAAEVEIYEMIAWV